MKKLYSLLSISFLLAACNNKPSETSQRNQQSFDTKIFYSSAVQDSFNVFISLPEGYDTSKKRYPVAFVLDANLYFDVIATTIKKYASVGLAPEAIVVGIGYKDFYVMDSLRSRDYTYPVAIPEYEMAQSGGAEKFLSFINLQLIPTLDSTYKTDTVHRVLMGHSLGGYFACYAFQKALQNPAEKIKKFVAASPSLHYNHYYLVKQLEGNFKAGNNAGNDNVQAYIAYGGLEDYDDPNDTSFIRLPALLKRLDAVSQKTGAGNTIKTATFSNLDHMETQIPIFLKGLNQLHSAE